MKYLVIFPLVVLLCLGIVAPVSAKLLINEFSSSSTDDWIEIYNDSQDSVLLSDFRIRDGSATNKLDLAGILAPYTVVAVDWHNRLNKSGDTIKIVAISNESAVEDQISYGNDSVPAPADTQSSGRRTNGSQDWTLFTVATKGSSNDGSNALQATPTMSPTPTNSPTPVKTPTPTRVPTATKIPTPTKVLSTGKTSTPTKSGSIPTKASGSTVQATSTTLLSGAKKSAATGVLAASDDARPTSVFITEKEGKDPDEEAVVVQSVTSDNALKRFLEILPIAGGVGSLVFCGILLYLHYRKTQHA